MTKKQKETEEFYLREFSNLVGWNYRIEEGAEPPDFFLRHAEEPKRWLEMTEHYAESPDKSMPRQAIEAEWEKLKALIEIKRDENPALSKMNCLISFKELPIYLLFAKIVIGN